MIYHNQIEQHIDDFPAMPPLSQRLLGYLDDPNVDFRTIGDMVHYDPGLTANVLKLANSVYFGSAQAVSSLQSALVRLGTRQILELVLSLTVSTRLGPSLPGYGLQARELLRHSIWTAVAAQELANLLHMRQVETVFTVGLLHDLGLLLLDPFLQKERVRFNEIFAQQRHSFEQTEMEILGIDHAEAGARILDNWQLSPEIVAGVRWHHEPDRAESRHRNMIYLIHLADMLALSEGVGTGIYGLQYNVSPESVKAVGLKKRHLEYTASKTLDKMRELEKILN
ncbi:MAG: HDOD domain-containing protein [Thermodesulfobacteriota bacterium]